MKYIIGMILILIIVSIGYYFWYTWDVGSFKDKLMQSTEDASNIKEDESEFNFAEASKINKDLHKEFNNSVSNTDSELKDSESKEDDVQSEHGHIHTHEDDEEEEIQESPFGFGVYPEIPKGFPVAASWNFPSDMFPSEIQRQGELVSRVLIKLYNEGDHGFIAGKWHKGEVYPIYPNTFYVEVNENNIEVEGKILRTENIRILGPSGTRDVQKRLEKAISVGQTLPGVRVRNMQEYGIDPYDYLFK